MQLIREHLRDGAIGTVFAVDLIFHNAYGPDKPWYYDLAQSGPGGCVLDLGIHLVDLALWALEYPEVARVTSRLYAGGIALAGRRGLVEDYAVARVDLKPGSTLKPDLFLGDLGRPGLCDRGHVPRHRGRPLAP